MATAVTVLALPFLLDQGGRAAPGLAVAPVPGKGAARGVGIGHDETDGHQQTRVGDELQVECPPGGADRLRCPIGDARGLGSNDAHQLLW